MDDAVLMESEDFLKARLNSIEEGERNSGGYKSLVSLMNAICFTFSRASQISPLPLSKWQLTTCEQGTKEFCFKVAGLF